MKTDRGLTASFWLLCLTGFLAFVSYDLIRTPALPLFAQSLGAGPAWVGLIVSISTVTGVLWKLPSGILSDRYGRSRLMLVGLAVFAAAPLGYLVVRNIYQLFGLRFVHGLATAIFAPVAMAVVADRFGARRGEALGWYGSLTQAGRLSGRTLSGALLIVIGFTGTFLSAWVVGLAGLAVFSLWSRRSDSLSQHVPAKLPEEWRRGKFTDAVKLLQDRRVVITSAMEAAIMLASGAIMAFLPLYGVSVGLNEAEVGLLFGIQGVMAIVSKPLMGRTSDRIGRRPMIITGLMTAAAAMFLLPVSRSFYPLAGVSVLFGLGEAVASSSTSAFVADRVERSGMKAMGSAMGMFGTIMDIGHASGPLLSGLMVAAWGYGPAFLLVGGMLLFGAAVFAAAVRPVRAIASH
jgi:MFS family permease